MQINLYSIFDYWRDWSLKYIDQMRPRELKITLPQKQALALLGVRRSGKTSKALEIAHRNSNNTKKNNFLYINFEDPGFIANNTYHVLDTLIDIHAEKTGGYPQIIVWDEIQNIDGWERWCRKFIDGQKAKLIITGSSAKMLSQELATSIAGRAIQKEIFPLSFSEFISFKGTEINETNGNFYLNQYMQWGGFPEVVLSEETGEKEDILRQYFTDIVLKDIISRNEIRSKKSLDLIVNHYLVNTSAQHSYNSLRKAYAVSMDIARAYTDALINAYLIFEIEKYEKNLKTQMRASKKIYAIDTGLRNVNSNHSSEDKGKLLENIIFLQLRRHSRDINYFSKNYECDFLVLDKKKPAHAIQVTYSNLESEELKKRELLGLQECIQEHGLNHGTLITHSREETIRIDKTVIHLIPAWKWLKLQMVAM